MPLGTYSGTYNTTQTPSFFGPYNPVTVTGAGYINVNSGVAGVDGLTGSTTTPGTVINQGKIQSVGNLGNGVVLQFGSSVSNSGVIQGTGQGVQISTATAVITNSGTITQTGAAGTNGVYLSSGGTVSNFGTITSHGTYGRAINSDAGLTVTNSTGAYVSGVFGIVSNAGAHAPSTVVNYGTVVALTGATHDAVMLNSGGGMVLNGSGESPLALINATTGQATGIQIGGAAGTVVNYGTVENTSTASGAGKVGGASPAVAVLGGGTVTNFGLIQHTGIAGAGETAGPAVYVAGTGTVTNLGGIITTVSTSGHDRQRRLPG
jgi:hypothetical protein